MERAVKDGFTSDDMLPDDTIRIDVRTEGDCHITEAIHLVRDGVVIATETLAD